MKTVGAADGLKILNMNEEEKKSLEIFENAPIRTAVFKNAIPAMAAMLMALIYNLADTFFIGQTHNDLQVAAVSLDIHAFLIFMAVGTVFGIGGTSTISRALGKGDDNRAKQICSFCMWGSVAVGLAMSALFLILMNPLLGVMGASADTWTYAKTYLSIVSLAGPFVVIANCFSNVIRAEGKSETAMMGQLMGNLLNVILDPIFILGFGWGIAGAAIATVIGNVVSAGYYISFFLRGKSILGVSIRKFTLKNKVASGVLSIGIPAALGSLMMSVSQITMNNQMSAYGDMALAGAGIAGKVTMITGSFCIGLGQGIQPLLGYCVGAEKWRRYKEALRFSLIFALLLSTVMTLICYVFTKQIVSIFLTDAVALDYGVTFARIVLTTSFLFGAFYVLSNALQALGAAAQSLIVNVSRQGLIYIPFLFILESLFAEIGLVWAQPVADILSLLLALILYFPKIRKVQKTVV